MTKIKTKSLTGNSLVMVVRVSSNSYHLDGSSVDGSSDVISRSQLTFISVHSSAVTTPLCTGCFGIWTFCGSDSDGAL